MHREDEFSFGIYFFTFFCFGSTFYFEESWRCPQYHSQTRNGAANCYKQERQGFFIREAGGNSLDGLAVFSPLYIDRRAVSDLEDDEQSINLFSWLPLLLLVLIILAIAFSLYVDQSYTRFDPYWIHRVGGSSCGIIIILMVLVLILNCKAET